MNNSWLTIDSLCKNFDGVKALDNFSCAVNKEEIVGLIGPNGAGKTTLFNVISGFIPSDKGNAVFKGKNLIGLLPHKIIRMGIARTFQDLRLIRRLTVLDNVLLSFPGQPGESIRNVFLKGKKCNLTESENIDKAISLLQEAGLGEKIYEPADNLSYGQQKLLCITCCLAAGADILLLDEPVAGIAPEMIKKILSIISELPKQGKSVILIEHNIDAVMQVCSRVIFMDSGEKISEGTPEEVRNDPKVIEAYID